MQAIDIVYTVVTRLELSKLQLEIEKIDNEAFFIMDSIKDAKGGMIKKTFGEMKSIKLLQSTNLKIINFQIPELV